MADVLKQAMGFAPATETERRSVNNPPMDRWDRNYLPYRSRDTSKAEAAKTHCSMNGEIIAAIETAMRIKGANIGPSSETNEAAGVRGPTASKNPNQHERNLPMDIPTTEIDISSLVAPNVRTTSRIIAQVFE